MADDKVAAIILAAGGSKRLGKPKQLLDWFGKSFIAQIIETARQSNLSPIIVVTGAYYKEIEEEIRKFSVTITRNEKWETGQASSLQAGIKALDNQTQSFIFFLCDQPQVPPELVAEIIKQSTDLDIDIVTASVDNKTCPPILFKKSCINDIYSLTGDAGGKILIKDHPSARVEWNDKRIIMDSDTTADYQKLIDAYKNDYR